jgi:hypothetical protein
MGKCVVSSLAMTCLWQLWTRVLLKINEQLWTKFFGRGCQAGDKGCQTSIEFDFLAMMSRLSFSNHINNHMVKLSNYLWREWCGCRLVSARLISHMSLCTQIKSCCVTTNGLFSRLQHWMIEMPCLLMCKGLSEL